MGNSAILALTISLETTTIERYGWANASTDINKSANTCKENPQS